MEYKKVMLARKINFALLLITGVFLISITSCKDEEEYTVGIDLTNSYNQDEVKVILDGKILLDESLQSNHSTGFAKILRVEKTEGNHTLKVIVNGTVQNEKSFSVKDDLYIFVNYNPATQKIIFKSADQPVFYD
jgi:hypothetical protein